jgi:cellulose synthase (UDP-forming)
MARRAVQQASRAPRDLPEQFRRFRPETDSRVLLIRTVAVIALLIGVAYLAWRAVWTIGVWWLGIPFWLLELHAVVGLALMTFSLWDLRQPVVPPPPDQPLRVAVLIPTINEPEEVLLPTIAGAVALPEAGEVLVLDDGHRPEVAALCERFGARYVARADLSDAKAGNLNHGLELVRGTVDVVAVLDADHVPSADFIAHTLPYFADPDVAIVQTPQHFYNQRSFEHAANRSRRGRRDRYSEQGLFYRAIQPGKNRWNASFWCGTNALLRVEALESVGGVATESLTEDLHTTLRLHRAGWRSVYHNEVLAHGLAARTPAEYRAQRLRWGTGTVQVLRQERPLTGPGLTVAQRLCYAATMLGWFDAWRTLGYVLVPIVVLATGRLPIRSAIIPFLVAFGTAFIAQRIALAALSRGLSPQGVAMVFEFVKMPVNLQATLRGLRARERQFAVTTKGQGERRRGNTPALLATLCFACVASLVWFAVTMRGRTPLHYGSPGGAIASALFAWANLVLVVAAMARLCLPRYAGDRRRGERFSTGLKADLDGAPAVVADISVSGVLVAAPLDLPEADGLTVHTSDGSIRFEVLERDRYAVSPAGTALIAVEFLPGQTDQVAALARVLFGSPSMTAPATETPHRSDRDGVLAHTPSGDR